MKNDSTKSIGPNVGAWREFRNIKSINLARICDVQPGYIYRLESGKINRPGENLSQKVASALRIPVAILQLGLTPQDLITPDVPNAAKLIETDGGIEVLLAIRFLKIARTKDARFWLEKPK